MTDAYLSLVFWLEVIGYLLACGGAIAVLWFGAAWLVGAI